MSLFAVKCGAAFLWHPAVHHSLLFLRALKQRHTLVLEPSCVTNVHPVRFWRLSGYGGFLSITAPTSHDRETGSSVFFEGEEKEKNETPSSHVFGVGLHCVHDPQHIPHFFLFNSSFLQEQQGKQLQAYLDAALVASQVLQAADDVLVALNMEEMEVTRQMHGDLMECVARLETCLQIDADDMEWDTERWSTWPLFSTLQFLVEEGGLLLGPFPRLAKAYHHLRDSKTVVAHTRFVKRTVELTLSEGESSVPFPAWPRRGFLREVQHRLAEYTTDPAERMMEGCFGEKGPLKARASGARFGLQSVSARLPWTMQQG